MLLMTRNKGLEPKALFPQLQNKRLETVWTVSWLSASPLSCPGAAKGDRPGGNSPRFWKLPAAGSRRGGEHAEPQGDQRHSAESAQRHSASPHTGTLWGRCSSLYVHEGYWSTPLESSVFLQSHFRMERATDCVLKSFPNVLYLAQWEKQSRFSRLLRLTLTLGKRAEEPPSEERLIQRNPEICFYMHESAINSNSRSNRCKTRVIRAQQCAVPPAITAQN